MEVPEVRQLSTLKLGHVVVQLWGVLGVAAILGNGARRVLPIALEPMRSSAPLPCLFWPAYFSFSAFMAYSEGYWGFHRKFSPKIVARSVKLCTEGTSIWSYFFAPLYCMELFSAPAHRIRNSWSFLTAIFVVVAAVKRLPAKPRAVVDAGVCTGLILGITSLLYHYSKLVITGVAPPLDDDDLEPVVVQWSFCPVTMLSRTAGGVLDAILGKQASVYLPKEQGVSDAKCPISGKIGLGCPMSKFVNVQAAKDDNTSSEAPDARIHQVDAQVGDVPLEKPNQFMAGKSLVASVQKDNEVPQSLLWRWCPLHWSYDRTWLCTIIGSVLAMSFTLQATKRHAIKRM